MSERSSRPGQERRSEWVEEPQVPEGITGRELERDAREELRSLSKETAERVARHLVAAGMLVEDDPETALAHARFAARRGGRVGAVRETYGVVAYQNGDFATAVRELRTAVRITGRHDLLPMIADCERGLGRPEKALDVASSPEAEKLGPTAMVEMMIVVAGAYADTGDLSTAIATLEIPALRQKVDGAWQVRLWVAYADLLEAAGRSDEARSWITLAADADTERITDAADRLGRPAPVVEDSPWADDEQVTVLDAYVDIDDDVDADADADEEDGGADAEDGGADLVDAIDEGDTHIDDTDIDDTDIEVTDADDADTGHVTAQDESEDVVTDGLAADDDEEPRA